MTRILSANPPLLALVLVTAAIAGVILARSTKIALVTTVVAFAVTSTVWGVPEGGAPDARYIAAFAIVCQLLGRPSGDWVRVPRRVWHVLLAAAAFTGWALTTSVWSIDLHQTLTAVIAWVTLLAALWIFATRLQPGFVLAVMRTVVVGFVLVSAVAIALKLPQSYEGVRARGIADNPNGLGIYCLLAVSVLLTRRGSAGKVLAVVPVVLCVLTGSRAAFAGIVVVIALTSWRSSSRYLKLIALPVIALAAVVALGLARNLTLPVGPEGLVFRGGNTRTLVWAEAVSAHSTHPWIGIGIGALPTESGSSYLKVLSECGNIGTTLALVLLLAMLSAGWRSRLATGLLAGCLVDGAFEGWLFTAGSTYAVFLLIIVVAEGVATAAAQGVAVPSRASEIAPSTRSRPSGPRSLALSRHVG